MRRPRSSLRDTMFGAFDPLLLGSVTDVVFVFLCTKPAFAFLALVAGLVAYSQRPDEASDQLPPAR